MNDKLLEVKEVYKTFDGVVQALKGVTIEARKNEIVGVVGENGAGKSTLMKILVGVYSPDSGELYHKEKLVPFPRNPKEAAKRGISIVYQENGVIPWLRVYQFLFLGHEDQYIKLLKLQMDRMKEQAREILSELHVECKVDAFMHELPLSTQKMVEIARAILGVRLESENAETTPIIILDEPTAPLTDEECKDLFKDLLKMKKNASFIFISHIIPEVMEYTDRVHVLRDGNLVAQYDLSKEKMTEEDLFRAIVGRKSSEYISRTEDREALSKELVLSANNLTKRGHFYDVSFDLHRGECVGFFGPAGSGKGRIIRTIAGLMNYDKGELKAKDQELKADELPHVRLARGIGYFSGETGKELFLNWSIAKNISIINMEKILGKVLPVIQFKAEKKMAEKIAEKLEIKAQSVSSECYSLSGGNKQKVSVGKWLERNPDILLLDDPTIGIDVGSREDIYEVLLEMKKNGISMILVSDEPKEYSILCDRIMFVMDGRIQKVIGPEEFRKVIST
ncbi:MAG: sugar ABC transporter ATP-binding protein [Spirochaetota bacterium]|nr:MAG: sugar ABC transporter ATP-binding protein [Spirochaetota bacterium]